ncbi:Pre-toxin TG [Fictibacillus enclensis]|uniref:YwqJ-related putative deaminase n=1 Tax=Fictibacillus enclensis TaxID=1017270 RepID=UPI0008158D24|nr:YwqJ-related putative deaminase [Fictibacillus enclensis]SCC30253.1 Pre-toxin TG [Fictibacillus enclensis]
MEIKIEPNRLAILSKRMLEHQNRVKKLQHSLERETGKASSILSRSEFPPPFSGQISATNGSIKETSQTIVQTLEYQAAWLSYFAHQASGADNVPLSLTQATAILAKYDDRFKDPGKTDGIDAGKLAKDAAGELTGLYDAQRAATGIDPATGEKISGWSRVMAGGMFVFGLTPIGKGVKAFKLVRTADKVIGVAKEGQAARRVVGSADVVKGAGSSRIDYLRNKYGKFTSEELNYRINLRGETVKELQKLKDTGISKKKMGPAFAGVYDKTTGKIHYSINDFDGILPDFHPLLKSRYNSMPQEVIDSYAFSKGAGSHAEVIALNKALRANPNADLDNFVVNVIRTGQSRIKPAGMMFPRCPHCAYLTDGSEIITEVSKNVK